MASRSGDEGLGTKRQFGTGSSCGCDAAVVTELCGCWQAAKLLHAVPASQGCSSPGST